MPHPDQRSTGTAGALLNWGKEHTVDKSSRY